MGRRRYLITEPDKAHFMTCTAVEWLAVFTHPEMVQILLDYWQYQREHEGLKLHSYVILKSHRYFVAQAPKLDKCVSSFEPYTARQQGGLIGIDAW